MKGKVLLLNPPGPQTLFRDTICTSLSKANYVWKPRGHVQFSAIIPPDWDAHFIDASLNCLDADEAVRRIRAYQPDIVVAAVSSIVWDKDYAFVTRVRKEFPDVHIVAFGDCLRERYFFDQMRKSADEVILNPFLYDVMNYRSGKFSTFQSIEAIQGLPKRSQPVKTYCSRHELFDNLSYRWPFVKHFRFAGVYTQFGCPMTCAYCSASKTAVTYRPSENVLEELEKVYRDGYREIHFGDDTFGSPKDNAARIMEGMVKRNYKFSWSAYSYPGLYDREYLKLARNSGCHTLVVGIESHNFSLLNQYNRRLTPEFLMEFIENCREFGIELCGDFILGFDEEDEESVRKTIDFALSSGVDYASFNCANPLIGSIIRDRHMKSGLIKEGYFGCDSSYNIPNTARIPSDRLKELRAEAVRRFYMRPGYVFKRLSRIRSFEEFQLRCIEGTGVFKNLFRRVE